MKAEIHNTTRALRFPIIAGLVMAAGFCVTTRPTGTPAVASQTVEAATIAGADAPQAARKHHWYQLGRASWYGHALQGLPTANGESYDMNAMTCAHRTLPLGSLVRVTNLRNHRSLVVRVNDRGPMIESRIIDLSYGAAKRLGFSHRGTAKVRVDLIDARPTPTEVAMLTAPDQK